MAHWKWILVFVVWFHSSQTMGFAISNKPPTKFDCVISFNKIKLPGESEFLGGRVLVLDDQYEAHLLFITINSNSGSPRRGSQYRTGANIGIKFFARYHYSLTQTKCFADGLVNKFINDRFVKMHEKIFNQPTMAAHIISRHSAKILYFQFDINSCGALITKVKYSVWKSIETKPRTLVIDKCRRCNLVHFVSGSQGLPNKKNTKYADHRSKYRSPKHSFGPLSHFPLGIQIILSAIFSGGSLWGVTKAHSRYLNGSASVEAFGVIFLSCLVIGIIGFAGLIGSIVAF